MALVRCPGCAASISELAGVCPKCGLAVKRCRECGSLARSVAATCGKCGAPFSPTAGVATAEGGLLTPVCSSDDALAAQQKANAAVFSRMALGLGLVVLSPGAMALTFVIFDLRSGDPNVKLAAVAWASCCGMILLIGLALAMSSWTSVTRWDCKYKGHTIRIENRCSEAKLYLDGDCRDTHRGLFSSPTLSASITDSSGAKDVIEATGKQTLTGIKFSFSVNGKWVGGDAF